ncbi:MAG: hypothetical protein ACETVZ_09715 [Phycisphaerae bacterium]
MVSYNPSGDELVLGLRTMKKEPTKQIGRFKLWWDKKDRMCGIAISSFSEELREFEEKCGWIHLRGIWKGVKIEVEDIKKARQELLKKLEERGEKY